MMPQRLKIVAFRPEEPNPRVSPLSETIRISAVLTWQAPPGGGGG